MIHRPLHTEPYTEHSSGDRKDPEDAFRYSPSLIYRLEFVYNHREIGEEGDTGDIDEEVL